MKCHCRTNLHHHNIVESIIIIQLRNYMYNTFVHIMPIYILVLQFSSYKSPSKISTKRTFNIIILISSFNIKSICEFIQNNILSIRIIIFCWGSNFWSPEQINLNIKWLWALRKSLVFKLLFEWKSSKSNLCYKVECFNCI